MNDKLKFFSIQGNQQNSSMDLISQNFLISLKNTCPDINHELIKFDEEDGGAFSTKGFVNLVYKKLELTHKFLKEGYTVCFSDLDIVFIKNPIDHMLEILENHDAVFQPDNSKLCTGFYMIKPTELTIDLFDTSYFVDDNDPRRSDNADQGYINAKLEIKKEKYTNLRIAKLDKYLFPNGFIIKDPEEMANVTNPFIMHFNWTTALFVKIERMKSNNLWNLDEI